MFLFFLKVVISFFFLCLDLFAESAIPEERAVDYYSASDVSASVNKYFENRQLTLTDDERRFLQTHFNYLLGEDFLTTRGDFGPLPDKWYEYSNILKRDNKRKGLASFIPYIVSFFSSIKKESGNILPSTTIRDIDMLDKKSPFDKLVAQIAKIVDDRKECSSSDEDVSFSNLIFLFRLLNAYNNREDIEEVLACNNVLLSDKGTMEELFSSLNSLQDDSDFLLHFTENIDFLQRCGLHRGEYDCYTFDLLEYTESRPSKWNGWFLSNLEVLEKFDFRKNPFSTEINEYPLLVRLNPIHVIFILLSKMLGKPGLLEFVDSWQIDNKLFLLLVYLFKLLKPMAFTKILLLLFQTVVLCGNAITLIERRLDIKITKIFTFLIYLLWIIVSLFIHDLVPSKDTFKEIIADSNDTSTSGSSMKSDGVIILSLIILCNVVVLGFIYLVFFWFQKAMLEYKQRLRNILFANDILRTRRYVRNIRDFYLKIRDKNEAIKSLFLKYLPNCSSLFDIDISKNESLNAQQKELFSFIFSDEETNEEGMQRYYYLFYNHKELLRKIIVETQYVGSYVIAAVLVSSGKFCLPQFKYSGENYIRMKDVVHPGIIDRCVKNSFEIGEKETGIRNMIFSGSNGTGKTTFQFTVVDNVILAQSLGIACCSEYSATVFDKIISMSNAKTDLSEGLSGYTSEVEMVKACLLYLWGNKDKRILLISDEPLSTTDPIFADWIVELIFRRIFSYPNVSSIVATHFRSPREIAEKYKHLNAGNFRFKIIDNGTSLENFHLLERGEGYNIGKTIAEQRGLLDLLDVNE